VEPVGFWRRLGGVGIRFTDVTGLANVSVPATFEEFYRREWAGAVRLAHLLTGVDAIAEDLAQESFARVHRHWASVDNRRAYLRATILATQPLPGTGASAFGRAPGSRAGSAGCR
jgi:hypothetical protein